MKIERFQVIFHELPQQMYFINYQEYLKLKENDYILTFLVKTTLTLPIFCLI